MLPGMCCLKILMEKKRVLSLSSQSLSLYIAVVDAQRQLEFTLSGFYMG